MPEPECVLVGRGHLDALRSTISFLSSVIRCGEPYTPDVQQAVENAYERIDLLLNDGSACARDS